MAFASSACTFLDPAFQLAVQLLQLARLAIQIGKYADLRAQQFRCEWHRHVVHRAKFITTQPVKVGHHDGGDEDDRGALEPRVFPDHPGQLEAVEIRHADIDQHDRNFVFQQVLQGLVGRVRLYQRLSQFSKYNFVAEQLCRLVIDKKDIHILCRIRSDRVHGGILPQRCSQIRRADSNCSVFTGLAR